MVKKSKTLATLTILVISIFSLSQTAIADSAEMTKRMAAQDKISSACQSEHVTKNCINTCMKYGFKDPFSDGGDYDNATNRNCQYVLATQLARNMKSDTKNIKRLKCGEKDALTICKGAGYRVEFSPTVSGIAATIKPPSGKFTKLSNCGTCSDNDWEYESGPLKKALLFGYDGGALLYLKSP
jgi:hypothetical protein